ncbi:MAG TPA: DUF4389 domain-containing protein [Leucothrix mucor]|uniref:DUF4389 domain-containing protein n=1 Tax=Leucothrix mucor TaxID=45248 RepID=A0A7V2SZ89_LEUMU|nr:DUF4389 domain-containing protein [Leucothrix mucor]
MSQEANLKNSSTWKRILYMLLFSLAYSVAEFVLMTVAVVQVLIKLFTGEINENLKVLGKQTALYIYDVMLFLTFNTEEKPFPFSAWPDGKK